MKPMIIPTAVYNVSVSFEVQGKFLRHTAAHHSSHLHCMRVSKMSIPNFEVLFTSSNPQLTTRRDLHLSKVDGPRTPPAPADGGTGGILYILAPLSPHTQNTVRTKRKDGVELNPKARRSNVVHEELSLFHSLSWRWLVTKAVLVLDPVSAFSLTTISREPVSSHGPFSS